MKTADNELFLYNSTTLGKIGLLLLEWNQLLYIRKGTAMQLILYTTGFCLHVWATLPS